MAGNEIGMRESRREYARLYYLRNRDKLNDAAKKYAEEHREEKKTYDYLYRKRNKDKRAAYRRERRRTHGISLAEREAMKRAKKKYYKKYPEKLRSHKRRQRISRAARRRRASYIGKLVKVNMAMKSLQERVKDGTSES
jgi:hypothetical protein